MGNTQRCTIAVLLAVVIGAGICSCGGGSSSSTPPPPSNPTPIITGVSPATASMGGAAFTLTVTGSNFVSGAVVQWNGSSRTTAFVSATQVTAQIIAADIASAGQVPITVSNPAPGGGVSNSTSFGVQYPVPTVAAVSPGSGAVGGAAFTLTVTGTNFVSGAVVQWNGSSRTTTFVSATQITAQITAADVASVGQGSITVSNPTPGGGVSNSIWFGINYPVPTLTAISPASGAMGGAAFTLTVTGTNFVSGAAVQWNGSNRATTFVSSTQLTAQITASDVVAGGNVPVTVMNPTPTAGVSNGMTFGVLFPIPTITSISPTTAQWGTTGPTLTVQGTNFAPGAVVQWNGTNLPTSLASGVLTAQVPNVDVNIVGPVPITVSNPAPTTGVSNALTLTVQYGVPTIGALSPVATLVGGKDFALTVEGGIFAPGAVVQWNGISLPTSGTNFSLTAQVPASDIAASGKAAVTVSNPAPGGGISSPATFNIMSLPRFAYAVNWAGNSVSMLTVDATTGQVRNNGYIATGKGPLAMAVDPAGKFAFVANGGDNTVSMYAINATTGALTGGAAMPTGTLPTGVTIDPSGRFLYVPNYNDKTISMFTISSTGTLARIGAGTVAAGINPQSVAVDPTGKFAFVANLGDNSVTMYTIDATTGALTQSNNAGAGGEPMALAVDPAGEFLYVTNYGGKSLSIFSINPSNAGLGQVATVTAGNNPDAVAVDPTGRFVYATNTGDNTVSMYARNAASGKLTPIIDSVTNSSTVATGKAPASVTVDPSGAFAYVVNQGDNTVSTYTINASTGALTNVGPLRVGSQPDFLALTGGNTPATYTPKFVYVANYQSNNVSMYTAGDLSANGVGTIAAGTSPTSIAADRLGRYVYVTNNGDNTVSSYSINATTGVLTSLPNTSTIYGAAGTSPSSIGVDITGKYVYITSTGGTTSAVVFANIGTDGSLATPNGWGGTGTQPDAIALDPTGRFAYIANYGSKTISMYTVSISAG